MKRLHQTGSFLLSLVLSGFAAAGDAPHSEATALPVWADSQTNLLGGPSRDGRLLSLVDIETGDLAILDLETKEKIRLTTNPQDSKEFAYFSSISPDSKQIAYAWFNDEEFYELRILSLNEQEGKIAGSEPRVLIRNPEAGFVQPTSWSPDGKQILTLLFRKDNISQIALVSAEDGSTQVLKSLNWVYPKKMEFSPDGKFIVYDSTVKEGSDARDIFLLSADGSGETKLVADESNDMFPVWTSDGTAIVFGSDRAGTMDAWMMSVADGKPMGTPRLIKKDLGRFLPMGITRQGDFYYGLRTGRSDILTASIDVKVGEIKGEPEVVRGRLVGANNSPDWSPDGRYLAYLSRWGTENFSQESRAVTIRDLETGKENIIVPKLAYLERIRWSPDGKWLLAQGSDGKSRVGLFQVDAQSGETTPVVRERSTNFRGFEGDWSRDGQAVFYVYQDPADEFSIRRLEIASYEEKTLHKSSGKFPIHDLALSPDGQTLAFATKDALLDQAEVLLVIPVEGGTPRQLLRARNAGLTGIEWLPDGSALLVGAPGKPTPSIWKIAFEGGSPEQLPIRIKHSGRFRLDPQGRSIAFASGGVQSEIWVMKDFLPTEQASH